MLVARGDVEALAGTHPGVDADAPAMTLLAQLSALRRKPIGIDWLIAPEAFAA
jgi:hypothetical protein